MTEHVEYVEQIAYVSTTEYVSHSSLFTIYHSLRTEMLFEQAYSSDAVWGGASTVERLLQEARDQVSRTRPGFGQGGSGRGQWEEEVVGDDGWEMEFRRVVKTIGDLEKEDEELKQVCSGSARGERKRNVEKIWGAGAGCRR